jgi:hypothetical protein
MTCPFHNHDQHCPVGWTGHPKCPFGDREAVANDCLCFRLTKGCQMQVQGERIAKALNLRKARQENGQPYNPPRYRLGDDYLTKTAVGVYLVIQDLAKVTRIKGAKL